MNGKAQIIEEIIKGQGGAQPQGQQPSAEAVQSGGVQAVPEGSPVPAVQAPPAQPQPDPELDRKFAALSKREREIFQKEQGIKEHLKMVEEYNKRQELKKTSPLEYLKAEGLDFDTLVNSAVSDYQPKEPANPFQSQLDEMRKEIDTYKTQLKEKAELEAKNKEKEAVDNFKRGIQDLIKQDAEKFELVSLEPDAVDTVYYMIEAHYEKTLRDKGEGEFMATDKAVELLENALLDKYKKVVKAKKLGLTAEPKANDTNPVTLTSQLTPGSSAPPSNGRLLDREEAIRKIKADFQARLAK